MADNADQNLANQSLAKQAHHLSLHDLREDYRLAEFSEENCQGDPLLQFAKWFEEAKAAELKEPNAMTVATATPDGRPSARIVLLKELSEEGFVFYTNYDSRKGKELKANPLCALTFLWAELERQVRVEGRTEKVSRRKSEEYFQGRPRGSRLGALVSQQSEVLKSRHPLEERLSKLEAEFAGRDDIPTPAYWGGFCVIPYTVEFWQGRTNRLHDRLLYSKSTVGWSLERLSP